MPQTKAEKRALHAAWLAHPQVMAFGEACENFAREQGLSWDIAGMNAVNEFAGRWMAEHGVLPDSGIACDGS